MYLESGEYVPDDDVAWHGCHCIDVVIERLEHGDIDVSALVSLLRDARECLDFHAVSPF